MKSLKPTKSELEILTLLWKNGPSSVRLINEELNNDKETVYTTTLKLLQIMFEKGLVRRTKEGRSHIYSAAVDEASAKNQLIDKFLDSAFGGSAGNLVLHLLDKKNISDGEIQKIKNIISDLEKN